MVSRVLSCALKNKSLSPLYRKNMGRCIFFRCRDILNDVETAVWALVGVGIYVFVVSFGFRIVLL